MTTLQVARVVQVLSLVCQVLSCLILLALLLHTCQMTLRG